MVLAGLVNFFSSLQSKLHLFRVHGRIQWQRVTVTVVVVIETHCSLDMMATRSKRHHQASINTAFSSIYGTGAELAENAHK
jgi:hypothetical protein